MTKVSRILFTFILIEIILCRFFSAYFSLQYIYIVYIYTCESIQTLINPQYVVHRKRYFYRSQKYIRAININMIINTILERFLQVFICDNVYLVQLFILDTRIDH